VVFSLHAELLITSGWNTTADATVGERSPTCVPPPYSFAPVRPVEHTADRYLREPVHLVLELPDYRAS